MSASGKTSKQSDKKKPKPLRVAVNSSWILKQPISKEDEERIRCYLQRFVMESEAIETSKLTNGFIKDLSIDRTQRADSFLGKLRLTSGGIYYRTCDNPSDLVNRLGDRTSEAFFEEGGEFVCFSYSTPAGVTHSIERLKEFQSGAKRKEGKRKQVKARFYQLDSLLRHLRNAFAHGQFRIVERDGDAKYIALPDANAKGIITARMLLKESTLDDWTQMLNDRDRRHWTAR